MFDLNKLGVVSKWIDIRASAKDLEQSIKESNCRMVVAFDILLPKNDMVLNHTSLEKFIIIKQVCSLPKVVQIAYGIKNKSKLPNDSRYIYFEIFVKAGDSSKSPECVPFDKDSVFPFT